MNEPRHMRVPDFVYREAALLCGDKTPIPAGGFSSIVTDDEYRIPQAWTGRLNAEATLRAHLIQTAFQFREARLREPARRGEASDEVVEQAAWLAEQSSLLTTANRDGLGIFFANAEPHIVTFPAPVECFFCTRFGNVTTTTRDGAWVKIAERGGEASEQPICVGHVKALRFYVDEV